MNDREREPDDEQGWRALTRHLEPLDALVPGSVPAWRPATLGVTALVGVAAAMLPAALAIMLVERLLLPDRDASEAAHGIALGVFVVLWGVLALAVLAVAARLTIGRGAAIARPDLALAAAVLLMQGAWVAALHAWNVGVAGRVELDLIGRGTYLWPAAVVSLVVMLAAARLTSRPVALVLTSMVAIGVAALVLQTLSNARGAIADGHVSDAGLAVGVLSALQLVLLAAWWWDVLRPRLQRPHLRP